MADSPYPELKKTHTMPRLGRPWHDRKPPASGPVWEVIQGFGSYWMLVAAIELKVFDALSELGPSSADELAAHTEASVPHLAALLDGLVALGLVDQVDDHYDLDDLARRYLVSDSPASMVDLVAVAPGPLENWSRLAQTVCDGSPAHPIDDDPAAFYVPLVEATFATQLRCATRADLRVGYSRLVAPRVLELGAGGAPWSVAVLSACPDGTATVNDLQGVIPVAARTTQEHGVDDRCEFRAGDFHAIAVEPGAYDIVVLGHVCRTEGEKGARHLIERAYAALRPEGRLLLADYFADNRRKHNPFGVLMGVTMLASTERGLTFTHERFHHWIHDAGFEAVRLVEPIGFNQVFVATKPREG